MRISLLRERENFEGVFAESLQAHFRMCHNENVDIPWSRNEAGDFICNDYLNVLFHRKLPTRKLESFTKEFCYQPSFLKRLAQTAYVKFACRKGLRRLTCKRRFKIHGTKLNFEKWIFIPGNHSIRCIDVERKRSIVFPKKGFNAGFLKAEVRARTEYAAECSPRIIYFSPEFTWYEEEIIEGLPYNRLANPDAQQKLLIYCESELKKLYIKTLKRESLVDYAAEMHVELRKLMKSLEDKITLSTAKGLRRTFREIQNRLADLKNCSIESVISHGDFQPANTMLGQDRDYIIDWEYSARRSRFYDAITWSSHARSHQEFPIFFERMLSEYKTSSDLFAWTGRPIGTNDHSYLWLFLLEDLQLKLKEVDSEKIKDKEHIIGSYSRSLRKVCDLLSRH